MVLKLSLVFSFIFFLFGCQNQTSDSKKEVPNPEAQQLQAHAEILSEMIRIVFDLPPESNQTEFTGLLKVISEGASYEGIYNGISHSDRYRKREMETKAASSKALKAFGEMLNAFEKDRKKPRRYDAQDALPLALPIDPASPPAAVDTLVFETTKAGSENVLEADAYSRIFVGASVFTLKRVLSDALLGVAREKQSSPEVFHRWYAEKAVYLNKMGVDFGLSERNSNELEFHRSWALRAPEGLAKWELLNRIHRILNQFQKG